MTVKNELRVKFLSYPPNGTRYWANASMPTGMKWKLDITANGLCEIGSVSACASVPIHISAYHRPLTGS